MAEKKVSSRAKKIAADVKTTEEKVEKAAKATAAKAKTTVKKVAADAKASEGKLEKAAKTTAAKAKTATRKVADDVKAAEKKVSSRKPAAKKQLKNEVIIQSPMGGVITPAEVLAKVGNVDSVYVRVDQNKAYWVRGEETGSIDLW